MTHHINALPYEYATEILHNRPIDFCHITESWLFKNRQVWISFFLATEHPRLAGRTRYGAKCVFEHLRYETALQDSERTFKLNNNVVSGLARLYNAVSGTEFYQTRKS